MSDMPGQIYPRSFTFIDNGDGEGTFCFALHDGTALRIRVTLTMAALAASQITAFVTAAVAKGLKQ